MPTGMGVNLLADKGPLILERVADRLIEFDTAGTITLGKIKGETISDQGEAELKINALTSHTFQGQPHAEDYPIPKGGKVGFEQIKVTRTSFANAWGWSQYAQDITGDREFRSYMKIASKKFMESTDQYRDFAVTQSGNGLMGTVLDKSGQYIQVENVWFPHAGTTVDFISKSTGLPVAQRCEILMDHYETNAIEFVSTADLSGVGVGDLMFLWNSYNPLKILHPCGYLGHMRSTNPDSPYLLWQGIDRTTNKRWLPLVFEGASPGTPEALTGARMIPLMNVFTGNPKFRNKNKSYVAECNCFVYAAICAQAQQEVTKALDVRFVSEVGVQDKVYLMIKDVKIPVEINPIIPPYELHICDYTELSIYNGRGQFYTDASGNTIHKRQDVMGSFSVYYQFLNLLCMDPTSSIIFFDCEQLGDPSL